MDVEVLHEVPESLKRLVRLVARGFYSVEHAIILDILVRHPCMKEDDMIELLKFERKQMRSMLNTLKTDKFIKVRMRVETDAESHTTRHNYYFINYKVFVNVVKYKLDHVRRKIEAAERQNTSRSSFKCPECLKTYTDLEAGQLLDPYTGELKCMICHMEVEEDESAMPKQDARTLLARFNEQIKPIYDLLKDCEDVRLAPEILDPEPVDLKFINQKSNTTKGTERTGTWSGDATRNINFGYEENTVTVTIDDESNLADTKAVKEQPVWMRESTVDKKSNISLDKVDSFFQPSTSKADISTDKIESSDDIMRTLLVHEKKSVSVVPPANALAGSDKGSSSDSDEEMVKPFTSTVVEEIDSGDEEEEETMVSIGDVRIPLHEVTDDMVAKMTAEEKENYIRLGQELYSHMYE